MCLQGLASSGVCSSSPLCVLLGNTEAYSSPRSNLESSSSLSAVFSLQLLSHIKLELPLTREQPLLHKYTKSFFYLSVYENSPIRVVYIKYIYVFMI